MHIKDSAKFFVDQLDPRYDRVGVIRYDRWGWYPGDGTPPQSMALTNDFTAVKTRIDNLDAFEPYCGAVHQHRRWDYWLPTTT